MGSPVIAITTHYGEGGLLLDKFRDFARFVIRWSPLLIALAVPGYQFWRRRHMARVPQSDSSDRWVESSGSLLNPPRWLQLVPFFVSVIAFMYFDSLVLTTTPLAILSSARLLNLGSGLSPILPLLLFGAVLPIGIVGLLTRTAIAHRVTRIVKERFAQIKPPLKNQSKFEQTLLTFPSPGSIHSKWHWMAYGAFFVVPFILLTFFYSTQDRRFLHTLEASGGVGDVLNILLACGVLLVIMSCTNLFLEAQGLRHWAKNLRDQAGVSQHLMPQQMRSAGEADLLWEATLLGRDWTPTKVVSMAVKLNRFHMVTATASVLCLLLGVASYPFQPSRVLSIYLVVLIVGVAALCATVGSQLAEVPSVVGATSAGEEQKKDARRVRGFVGRFALWAGLPTSSLLIPVIPVLGPFVDSVLHGLLSLLGS